MLWLKWLFSQSRQCLDLGSYNSNRAVWISRDNPYSVLLHSLWQQNWESENVSNGHLVHQLKVPFPFCCMSFPFSLVFLCLTLSDGDFPPLGPHWKAGRSALLLCLFLIDAHKDVRQLRPSQTSKLCLARPQWMHWIQGSVGLVIAFSKPDRLWDAPLYNPRFW